MAMETIHSAKNTSVSDFQYPYDLNAESALLGSLILDNNQLGDVSELIKAGHFYHLPHKLIFETMVDLYDKRRSFDVVILKDELLKKGNLDKAGGIENIVSICPNCHREIHYGEWKSKSEKIKLLFRKQQDKLKQIGILITEDELLKLYKNG